MRRAFMLLGVVGVVSCGALNPRQDVLNRAAFELSCQPNEMTVVELGEFTYGVMGCGKKTTYIARCQGGTSCEAIRNSEILTSNK